MTLQTGNKPQYRPRMGDILEDDCDWKHKCTGLTEKIQTLETISKDVLKEYDETLKKFEEVKRENEALQKKVFEKNDQIKEVNKLIEPALVEYDKLKNKYEIEKGCRYEAQSYATQVAQKNKKLQRQSMDLIGLMNQGGANFKITDINFDDEEEQPEEDEYHKSLNSTIKELKNEVATLKALLSQNQEDLRVEKENKKWASNMYQSLKTQLKQTEASLKDHKAAIKELSKVSEAAYEEYESLTEKYELEKKRRSFVEKKVAEFTVENTKMKRQSEVLLSKVTPGNQLHMALIGIEDLTDKLEKQRLYYDEQISELESKIDTGGGGNTEAVEALESEKQELSTERDDLTKKVQEYETKYAKLEEQYDVLLKKYEDSKRPPPPPPPPPPPAISTSKGFLSRITKRKKSDIESTIKLKGGSVSCEFNQALEEMMSNIKKGKSLRPTLKPIKKSEAAPTGQAMAELHNIMSKMKRNHSEGDLLAPQGSGDGDSELARTFRRVKKTPSVDTEPEVQRRNKLSQVHEERESEVLRTKPDPES